MSETARTEGVFWVRAGDLHLSEPGAPTAEPFRIGMGKHGAQDGGRAGPARGLPGSPGESEIDRSGPTIIRKSHLTNCIQRGRWPTNRIVTHNVTHFPRRPYPGSAASASASMAILSRTLRRFWMCS